MKKITIVLLCLVFALYGCSNDKVKVTDAQLQQLRECADYTQKYSKEMMTNDIEILNTIITLTDGFEEVYYSAYKNTNYKVIVDEISDIYGYSKSESVEIAKRYTYHIRLKALLLSNSDAYEAEFKKLYDLNNSSPFSKYAYDLNPELINMSEEQFARVSDAYVELLSTYTDDVDKIQILTELKELYDDYEEYEYPQYLIDLTNQILDRHSVQLEPERELDEDFIRELQSRV